MLSNTGWNRLNFLRTNIVLYGHWKLAYHFHNTELDDEVALQEWNRAAYAKLVKLSYLLKNVEHIDGNLINVDDDSVIKDAYITNQMQSFNSLARALIRVPSSQLPLKKTSTSSQLQVGSCFSSINEWRALTLDSLTKICNLLGISAQQRKDIRLKVCPQVTQHHIWRGALEEVLKDLKHEIDNVGFNSPGFQMARQVMVSCFKFLEDTASLKNSESPAWMRLPPLKKVEVLETPFKWEEVLEMFVHISRCMCQEERFLCSLAKVNVMKEGLYQIKDIVIERDISFKEARRYDSLLQKKLTKSLGHSSKCLFTLLLYYLYGIVQDIEVDVCAGVCDAGGNFTLKIGKFLTSDDEKMVRNGVKQLYRALGVFKFVWETASMNGTINLQGHLWSVGANEKTLTYRKTKFFVNDIVLLCMEMN
ncbi:uncharacterized protein LOC110037537 [Phalaenopsis equestris]|uniref:uncharacterized protein LOC110037537 n=1 Tax=Phalaenopsis equestris TaxID=78828 RepID=UPI0009E31C8C|nr:uncharacterized protein LOC110037537 [Phalaenopsis equestris]